MTKKTCSACGGSGRNNDSIAGDSRNACQRCGGSGKVADYTNGGATCFPAGTKIQTSHGNIPIEQLNPGDHVIAVRSNGETGVRRIKRCRHYSCKPISVITFNDGSRLRVTDHHTVKTCRGWIMVRMLRRGDSLVEAPIDRAGTSRTITAVDRAETNGDVYNLIVEGDCTFIAEGIIAHSFTRLRVVRTAIEKFQFGAACGLATTGRLAAAAFRAIPHCFAACDIKSDRFLWRCIVLFLGCCSLVAAQDKRRELRDSAFTYFQKGTRVPKKDVNEFQLNVDYNALRTKWYLSNVRPADSNKQSNPVVVRIPNDKPIRLVDDAKFEFRNATMADIFYGRFALIRERDRKIFHGKEQLQGHLQMFVDAFSENADARMIINAYVDEADNRYGGEQVNGATPWALTQSMVTYRGSVETGRKLIATHLFHVDSKLSALYGRDPKGNRSALSLLMKTRSGNLEYILEIRQDINRFFNTWPKGTSAHAQLIENLIRFHSRSLSLQDEAGAGVQVSPGDRLFPPQVYKEWANGNQIPGRFISAALRDKKVGTSELSAEALRRFLALIKERGIQESDVTAEMVTGKLNPHPEDMLLVHKGLAPRNEESIKNDMFRFAVANRLAKSTDDPADVLNWRNPLGRANLIYLGYRETQWIRRFGPLEGAVGLRTIYNGRSKDLEMKDIYTRLGIQPPPTDPDSIFIDRYDKDRDRKISRTEMSRIPRFTADYFDRMDSNHDGFIEKSELPVGAQESIEYGQSKPDSSNRTGRRRRRR